MRNVEIPVYKFSELSAKTQQILVDKSRDDFNPHWYETVFDDIEKGAEMIGIDIDEIHFELHRKGSGASFDGSYEYKKDWEESVKSEFGGNLAKVFLDVGLSLQAAQEKTNDLISANLTRICGSGYSHEYTVDIEVLFDGEPSYESEIADSVYGDVVEALRDFMKAIYKMLDNHYDSITGDDVIKEYLIEKDLEYYEDGRVYKNG